MLDFFKKPHPFIFNIYSVVIPSLITFLIIVAFAPFQFQAYEMFDRMVGASVISLLVALGILLSVKGLQKLFPTFMSEDRWTLGKEFLLFFFVLLTIMLLVSLALALIRLDHHSLGEIIQKTVFITFAISILPIIVTILFEQYRHQKKQLAQAAALTQSLQIRNEELRTEHTTKLNADRTILLKSENNELELQLTPQELLYLKSDGNYVEVYFQHSESVRKKVIRNRLKTIETLLPPQLFFRCHNRYIVNGTHIISIKGNARNLLLHLRGASETIPVSRTKAKSVAEFLDHLQTT